MIAALPRWVRGLSALLLLLLLGSAIQAQERVISGKVTDSKDGTPMVGATVTVKGSTKGVSTGADGSFRLGGVPANAKTLVVTSIGFTTQEFDITKKDEVIASLVATNAALNEVVVVGYGTARKKDLTGSVATVKEKDFNQGIMSAPDQLIQGKIAGVQILNNSGQPGGATTVRIRGTASIRAGNGPLYVVDGIPLSGGSSRPSLSANGVGATPDANPLNFINPQDIASMDVLKDASATAIYGSRGANGVVLITTKRGQTGAPKVDVNTNFGFSNMLKKLDVLSGDQYREALKTYNVPAGSDWGGNVDAMDEITRNAFFQNYNVSVSAGTDNARIRASFGYFDQDGIVIKTGMKKYSANINGAFKFLESKKLGLDFSVLSSNVAEQIAPISNNAGFEGSLIGQALQWNPTRALHNPDGSINIKGAGFPATAYNPIAFSEAYDDKAVSTNILASISPYYKITKDLEYRMLMSLNYSIGNRNAQMANWMNLQGIEGRGWGAYLNGEGLTRQITHTLNYNKQVSKAFYMAGTLGYEYMRFDNQTKFMFGQDFPSNEIPYTDYFQVTSPTTRAMSSGKDPSAELQSLFGRVNVNYLDRFLATVTLRADGSNKFGTNNKYGYFPSAAVAWNISSEEFMKSVSFVNNLKLRIGWGQTGNQDFPSGASQDRRVYVSPDNVEYSQLANPDLRWETSTTINFGLEFSLLKNRLNGSIEYFNKTATDLLFFQQVRQPAAGNSYWVNIDPGKLINSGVELTLNADLIQKEDMVWSLGVYASFLKNELQEYQGATIETGEISGQGLSGAFAQRLGNGQPINAFYMGKYLGMGKDGKAEFEGGDANENKFFVGDPNPHQLLGLSTTFAYKRFSVVANMNGAFGQKIYNNTTQATLAIGNIKGNRNIAQTVYNPSLLEDPSSSQPVSTRYLEKGDYLKMANLTFSYNVGKISNVLRNANVFVTGQNLFILTDYSGFDPEVNTPKPINGVPSFGIEYTPYPPARTFMLGIQLSL
jgi:TonB-linked SusC/RagA family outer membrane protein